MRLAATARSATATNAMARRAAIPGRKSRCFETARNGRRSADQGTCSRSLADALRSFGHGGRSRSSSHARCTAGQGARSRILSHARCTAGQGECSRKIRATRSCNRLKGSLVAVIFTSFVPVFGACRCDENGTLHIWFQCGIARSASVAMRAQAQAAGLPLSVNAVALCCWTRAIQHGPSALEQPPHIQWSRP
jgi:hypothetical protein